MERFWRPPRSLHFASLDSSSLAIVLPLSIASHHFNSHPGFTSFSFFPLINFCAIITLVSLPPGVFLYISLWLCLLLLLLPYLPLSLPHSNVGDAYIGVFPTFLIRHTTSPQFYLRILVNLTSCCSLSFIVFLHSGFINSSSFCSSISPPSTRLFRPLRCHQVSIYFLYITPHALPLSRSLALFLSFPRLLSHCNVGDS